MFKWFFKLIGVQTDNKVQQQKEITMTLLQAHESGRPYRKVGSTAGFARPTSFVPEDLTASYEIQPEVAVSITMSQFVAAWNTAKGSSTAVAAAPTGRMFQAIASQLGLS